MSESAIDFFWGCLALLIAGFTISGVLTLLMVTNNVAIKNKK